MGVGAEAGAARVARAARAVLDVLYPHRAQLEAIFRSFDTDGNGSVSYAEFCAGCELLNQHLPTDVKAFDDPAKLMDALDVDHSGEIQISEFLETFRVTANHLTS